jgi:hypothetical protein
LKESYHLSELKLSSKILVRKLCQIAILQADVLLERIKLWIVSGTNYRINCLQHRLFLLSMEVDKRLLGDC